MTRDPSMRGFRERADVASALQLVDGRTRPLESEEIAPGEASGRALSEAVVSPVDVPAFPRAAMDGYAVVAEETFSATPEDPRIFRVAGESLPARPAGVRVRGDLCVSIMTGAPMPEGADGVVMAENARREGGRVLVSAPTTPGKHVGEVGEDVRSGTTVLGAGRILRPQDLGLLASIGVAAVRVVRRPRVALLVTGDEILPAGSRPEGFRIVDSNSPMLGALLRRDGGLLAERRQSRDDAEEVREAMAGLARNADCLLVTGGTSVGVEDHAPRVLRGIGELPIHGIAMRPSSPTGIGFLAGKPVFLLPGNPVSCLCAYDFFAGRAIRAMAGLPREWPYRTVSLPLRRKIVSELGRTDYVRVRIEEGLVEPIAVRGAAVLTSTTRADGFVVVERDLEGHPEGALVTVNLY